VKFVRDGDLLSLIWPKRILKKIVLGLSVITLELILQEIISPSKQMGLDLIVR
jgi:hypothetical protein